MKSLMARLLKNAVRAIVIAESSNEVRWQLIPQVSQLGELGDYRGLEVVGSYACQSGNRITTSNKKSVKRLDQGKNYVRQW